MKRSIPILLILLGSTSHLNAQNLTNEGTDFWVGFPEVYDNTAAIFEINVSARTAATGTVEILGTGFLQNFNVAPGIVTTISIPSIDANVTISEAVINRAIHVTTDNPVTVYASTFHLYRSEATVVLPVPSLGSDYMVTTYPNRTVGGLFESEFMVVAGSSPCTVEITTSCNTSGGNLAGVPWQITLNPGEFYMVQAAAGALDLTGSTIVAVNGTDKFAVYNGHKWTHLQNTGCTQTTADPLYEIAYPVASWGYEHIAMLTNDQSENLYRVIAKDNGTSLSVDGSFVTTLNAGDVYDGSFSNETIYITADKQIAVTQSMVTGGCSTTNTGDPSMVMINANEQMYLDTVTFYAVEYNGLDTNYASVVTRSADTSTMQFNYAPLIGWTILAQDPDYSYKIFGIDTGSHNLTTTGCGFLAYTYGLQWAESYFYAAGVRVNMVDDSISFAHINSTNPNFCDIDTIEFVPFTSGGTVVSYFWDFGDGNTSTEESPVHVYLTDGTFDVSLIIEYLCSQDTITEQLTLYGSPSMSISGTNVTCFGWDDGTVTTSVTDGTPAYSYLWNTGQTTANLNGIGGGTYGVTVTDQNGCTAMDSIVILEPLEIIVNVAPAGPFSPADPPENMSATPPGGSWSSNCGVCINSSSGEFDPFVAGVGTWQICYTAGTPPCDITECINVLVDTNCAIGIYPNNPTCYGYNDGSFTVNVSGGTGPINYMLTDDQSNVVNSGNSNVANNLNEGWYYVNVSDDVCTWSDSVFIDDPDQMTIDLSITNVACNGDLTGSATVDSVHNATGDYNDISFFWNPNPGGTNGIGQNTLTGAGAGTYTLLINDENGCSEQLDVTINEPTPLVFVQLGGDPAYCRQFGYQSGNGVVYAAASGGTPGYYYEWTDQYDTTSTNNTTWGGLNPSVYIITVTDANGCILTDKITLDSLNPIADFTMTSLQFVADFEGTAVVDVHFVNQSMYFANPNNPTADTSFFWNFGLDPSWVYSDDYYEEFDQSYTMSGEYFVCLVALNKNGCSDTACKTIVVFDPPVLITPNVFTPGPDGINSTFFFPNVAIVEFSCVVVDRWGIVLFEFDDINDYWDGNDKKGNPCPDGVYFYMYEATSTNGTFFEGQGNIHLIREK